MTDIPALRLDKWLWFARFFKTRSLATKFCASGRLRANGTVVSKAHHTVRPGDVLTFPIGHHVRVVKIAALGERRGPAPEARLLYEDLAPPEERDADSQAGLQTRVAPRLPGTGRPTKSERRATDRLRDEI